MSDLKQSVTGFKVCNLSIKRGKDTEKVRLVLEASVEDVKAGEFDVGDVINGLTNALSADSELGLSVFIKK